MLPAYIINQIREREARRREEQRPQPTIELPQPPREIATPEELEPNRGVVIIDLL